MNRDNLREELMKGKMLTDIFPFQLGQMCEVYKGDWEKAKDDDVIYIGDVEIHDYPLYKAIDPSEIDYFIGDMCYTKRDFIDECDGNLSLAMELYGLS